jgi:hypothetical protein
MGVRNRLVDDTIETLADSEHLLARHLAVSREMLHVALEQLHDLTRQRDSLLTDNRRLREECRRQRETTTCDARRAAA